MKKVFPLIIAVLLSGMAMGQNSFGIKGGLNVAKLKLSVGSASGSSDDLLSFHAGFYATLMTSEKFGFQPEIYYSAQGGGGSGGDFKMGYINVPVMMRFSLSDGISLQAGPQLSFLMNATVGGVDAKSAMNTVDFGAGFGLGLDRPSGVNFTFRYNIGFTNTLTPSATSQISGLGLGSISMTNQVIQFSLGFRLGGGEAVAK